jgi:predicted Rossmann fold nucleotide-binding protein DprA/Smf involved in DNA uptake
MSVSGIRPETEATLLLCGSLAPTRREEPAEPLNVSEFNQILDRLEQQDRSLPDVLDPAVVEELTHESDLPAKVIDRLGTLMQRGNTLTMAAQRWASQGFWVLDRTDPAYPERFHQHLRTSAPPLLYGAGDWELLIRDQVRVAVVGSRDIDEGGEAFARGVGARTAEIDAITVSGGARGADRSAIDAALENQGAAIAILPGALEQLATSRMYREAIAEGRLLAFSPYHPRAKFTAGNAMGRNRLIYCLADVGIVVESAEETGGTWSGATEALRNCWVPVGVRQTATPSAGNTALMDLGGVPLSPGIVDDRNLFQQWLNATVAGHNPGKSEPENQQLGMFGS